MVKENRDSKEYNLSDFKFRYKPTIGKYKNVFCCECGSNKTYVRKTSKTRWHLGRPEWYKHPDIPNKFLCNKCYLRLPQKQQKRQQLSKIYHKKQHYYKNRNIHLDYEPRIGVCNWCRAVAPFDTKMTHIHHEQYDDNNPSKHTIEICVECHRKETLGTLFEMNGKVCSNCKSNKTFLKKHQNGKKYESWHRNPLDKSQWLCENCYKNYKYHNKNMVLCDQIST